MTGPRDDLDDATVAEVEAEIDRVSTELEATRNAERHHVSTPGQDSPKVAGLTRELAALRERLQEARLDEEP